MEIEVVNLSCKDRPQYRLGDAVLRREHKYGRLAFDMVADNQRFFDGTILFEYAARIDRDSCDPQWRVLRDIVMRQTEARSFARPDADELVVHLRLGNAKGYGQPPQIFADYVLGVMETLEISKVSVVTAIHYGASFLRRHGDERLRASTSRNRKTVEAIFDLLTKRGVAATLRSNPNVDRDFCFLANARQLVLGNGHFSLCSVMISNAQAFVPPWARKGTDLNIDTLLASRIQWA